MLDEREADADVKIQASRVPECQPWVDVSVNEGTEAHRSAMTCWFPDPSSFLWCPRCLCTSGFGLFGHLAFNNCLLNPYDSRSTLQPSSWHGWVCSVVMEEGGLYSPDAANQLGTLDETFEFLSLRS